MFQERYTLKSLLLSSKMHTGWAYFSCKYWWIL
jgi:hypothetical protein